VDINTDTRDFQLVFPKALKKGVAEQVGLMNQVASDTKWLWLPL
jgi:hypothetical protein